MTKGTITQVSGSVVDVRFPAGQLPRIRAKAGARRWMSQRSASRGMGAPPSMGCPSTLNMRPRVHAPTGTRMPCP